MRSTSPPAGRPPEPASSAPLAEVIQLRTPTVPEPPEVEPVPVVGDGQLPLPLFLVVDGQGGDE